MRGRIRVDHRLLIHLLCFLPILTLVSPSGVLAASELRIPLEVDRLDVRDVGRPGDSQLSLPGGRVLSDYGQPSLPLQVLELVVPRDRSVAGVRLEGGREISLGTPLGLRRDAGQISPEVGRVWEHAFTAEEREGARRYPPLEARLAADQFEHGYHLVQIEVFPLRLDPTTGELWLREGAQLVVDLAPRDDGRVVVDRLRRLEGWEEGVRAKIAARVANPADLELHARPVALVEVPKDAPAPQKTPSLRSSPVRHLILTTDALRTEFERLAEHRTRNGLPSVVVTLSEVLDNYRQGADTAETIRAYVADAYAKWGVDYLLLGGDTELLPTRYVNSTFYPAGSSTNIPTDLYFGALEGNWNADGDAVYGEPFLSASDTGDAVDFSAEVAVGRAPVKDLLSAEHFVDKVLAYEMPSQTGYQSDFLFLSEVLFPSDWEEGSGQQIQLDGVLFSEEIVDSLLICDPDVVATRMYQNYTPYPGAVELTKPAALDSLDSGHFGVVHHIGHGFYFNMSVGTTTIVPADADALTNGPNYFLLYSLNCSSSAFDFDCLNERFLTNPAGGSVVSIGSSRAAFPNTAHGFQEAFYEAWLCDGHARVGDALVASRNQWLSGTIFNTADRWTQFVYTLLGDPALLLWDGPPKVAQVQVPASVALGDDTVTVTVLEDGTLAPLEGVTVTLQKDAEDYATGVTDASGSVSLDFTTESLGDVIVQVSGGDVLPATVSVPVLDPSAPYLGVAGLSFSDDFAGASAGNGNGRLEGGETIEISPLMHNGGSVASTATSAVLRTDDPYVTLIDSVVVVPALAPGASAASLGAFAVSLAATLPDAHEAELRIVTDSGTATPWVDRETILLATPELEVVSVEIDDSNLGNGDGVMQAGESVELRITLKNYGSGAVQSASGVLTSSSGGVTVVDASGSWTAASGVLDETVNLADPFVVQEADVGVVHDYELTVTDDQGRVLVHGFDLRAPAQVSNLGLGIAGTGEVVLQWDPSGEADLLGYRVFRKAEGESEFTLASPDIVVRTSYFRDENLTPLSRFEYQVAAVDSGTVTGPLSGTVIASTAPPEISCFPLPLGLETSGDLAISHLDNDGTLDMVIGADLVYAIDGTCTEKLDGDDDAQTFGPISSIEGRYGPASITLANLDPDGGMEIIASNWDELALYVFDENGNVLPGWPQSLRNKNWSTPAVGDVDGDGDLEIVLNDVSGYTYAFHHDGTEVADGDSNPSTYGVIVPRRSQNGFNENFGRTSPALYDVDGDGEDEILFGSKFQNGQPEYFYAWNADGSVTQAPGWPKTFPAGSAFLASPTIADIDDNGDLEILQLCENDSLYVWNLDGSNQAGFPIRKTSDALNKDSLAPSVAVGDFTGDGKLEMVVVETLGGSSPSSRVNLIDWQGNTLSGWPKTIDNLSESSPVVGDIDGDSQLDIVFGVGGGSDNQPNFLYAWNAQGEDVQGFPILLNGFVRSTPTLCDFDGDGSLNIALASWDRLIHVWDMGTPFVEALVPWPTFRGNVNRNGVFGFEAATDAPLDGPSLRRAVLQPNRPNPFNPSTEFHFALPQEGRARLSVFDVQGRRVRVLVEGYLPSGEHVRSWDGRDDTGLAVSSGVYYARLEVDGVVVQTRKMALVK